MNIDVAAVDLNELDNVPLLQRCDTTFVRKTIEILYKNDIGKLKYRTLSGGTKRKRSLESDHLEKEPITPSKRMKIISLFERRLGDESISDADRIKRINNLNKMISNSIVYISAYQKPAFHSNSQ